MEIYAFLVLLLLVLLVWISLVSMLLRWMLLHYVLRAAIHLYAAVYLGCKGCCECCCLECCNWFWCCCRGCCIVLVLLLWVSWLRVLLLMLLLSVYAWVLHVLLTCALAFNILGDFYLQRVFLTAQRESLTRFGPRASSICSKINICTFIPIHRIFRREIFYSALS